MNGYLIICINNMTLSFKYWGQINWLDNIFHLIIILKEISYSKWLFEFQEKNNATSLSKFIKTWEIKYTIF